MHALHRRDHIQLRETPDVGRVEVLGVLDAPAQVGPVGVGREHLLVEVEHLPVGAVADGVGVHLVAVPDGHFGGARDVLHRLQYQPGVVDVDVVLEQPGPVRPQRPVDLALDGAHGEEVVALGDGAIVGQLLVHDLVRLPPHHHVEAHRERPLGRHRAQAIYRLEIAPGVLEGGDPEGQRLLARQLHRAHELRVHVLGRAPLAGTVDGVSHQQLGGLAQQTGGGAGSIAHNGAARRIGGVVADTGELHRERVGKGRVPAGMPQADRILRAGRRERGVQRHAIHVRLGRRSPLLLVPAAPGHPLTRRRLGGRVPDHPDDVVPAGGGGEVENHLRAAQAHVMPVPLDEAGNHQPAAELDDLRGGADVSGDLVVRPHGRDGVPGHRKRLRLRQGVVHGHDLATRQNQIRVPGAAGLAGGQQDTQQERRSRERNNRRQLAHGNSEQGWGWMKKQHSRLPKWQTNSAH